jgi:peptide/nickel transport system substrate-binding protein
MRGGGGGGGGTRSNTPPGTLEVGIEAEPPELDPDLSSAYVDRQVMASIYDRLVDIDENGKIVPMLAESYAVSEDGREYAFELRQGVRFHDGEPFDAAAVEFNLERYQEEDSVRRTEIEPVESVEAVDDSTVRITLERPFAPFLAVLTDRAGIMVSPKAVQGAGASPRSRSARARSSSSSGRAGTTSPSGRTPTTGRTGSPSSTRSSTTASTTRTSSTRTSRAASST